MFKKIDKEILFGGILGIIAIVAAAGEMIANGISTATILGAIKDIAGTLVAVMVFIIAVRHLFVKKATDFDGVFEAEMKKIIAKYAPIISKDSSVEGRYNIASNLDSILGKEAGAYHTMFDTNSRTSISFNISKTVFMGKSKDSFDDLQQRIATQIGSKLKDSFDIVDKYEVTGKGFKLTFKEELKSNEDAVQLAEIVDSAILLYFVEYKK